jgi:general secretion pathway protein L
MCARLAADWCAWAGRWWIREFLNLFPERTAKWLAGPGRGTLVLMREGDTRVLELLDGSRQVLASTRIGASDYSAASIGRFFRTHGFESADADIGIRLASGEVFRRRLILPAQAAGALDDIIATDLARKTPFRLHDVYHGHCASASDGAGKIVVWQWLVRRAFVQDAAVSFDLDIGDVAFVDTTAGADVDGPAPFIVLRPDAKARHSWIRKSMLALAGSAVVFALAAGAFKYARQQETIDTNDIRITAARGRAQKVRAEFDKIEEKQKMLLRLRMQKSDLPGLLDLWEEATRVLPAHSWLTELRLTEIPEKKEQLIAMTGFSGAATDLVKPIDESALLADASLTAPVTLDPVEGRERFSLQAKVRRPGAIREAAR